MAGANAGEEKNMVRSLIVLVPVAILFHQMLAFAEKAGL